MSIKTLKQGREQVERALRIEDLFDRAEALSDAIYDLEEYKETLEALIEDVEEQIADARHDYGIAEETMRSHDHHYEIDMVECGRAW